MPNFSLLMSTGDTYKQISYIYCTYVSRAEKYLELSKQLPHIHNIKVYAIVPFMRPKYTIYFYTFDISENFHITRNPT